MVYYFLKCVFYRKQKKSFETTKLLILYCREQTITAHHNRIEQLRESYAKKLQASEITCRTVRSLLTLFHSRAHSSIK